MFKHKYFYDKEDKEVFTSFVNSVCEFMSYSQYKSLFSLCEERELTKEEFLTLCFLDKNIYNQTDDEYLWDVYDTIIGYVEDVIYDIIDTYEFEEIDDRDTNFPDNLYHTGYKYNDIQIYDHYTGNAGHYWETLFM